MTNDNILGIIQARSRDCSMAIASAQVRWEKECLTRTCGSLIAQNIYPYMRRFAYRHWRTRLSAPRSRWVVRSACSTTGTTALLTMWMPGGPPPRHLCPVPGRPDGSGSGLGMMERTAATVRERYRRASCPASGDDTSHADCSASSPGRYCRCGGEGIRRAGEALVCWGVS
jgi:hypothetical protein